jgi:hypothetical protein
MPAIFAALSSLKSSSCIGVAAVDRGRMTMLVCVRLAASSRADMLRCNSATLRAD